ncbi:MAG: hypothetical protein IJY24_04345, partial [Clostridia bacterium]|nr:hypothetical protein [Clostridia bacterium]
KVSFNLDFTSCEAQELGSVSFSGVTAPTEGQHPIYNAPVMGGSYTLVTDDEVSGGAEYGFVDGVRWSTVLESLNAESVFEAGVRYSLSFFIKSGDIYRFSNWVEASSDVGYVSVETMLHDPTLAFVTIEFAPCSGGVLNEVNVGGVDAPANGAHPDYDFTLGQGYAIDETNGVVWVDVTDNNKVMTPSDVFVYGHEYELFIVLCSDKAINGESGKFEFAPISSISAKINGENASRVTAHGDSPEAHCIELSQVYQCGKGIVGQVSATVTEPVEDSHPADRITVVGGMVGKYEFIDEDAGNSLKTTDTFAADKNYYFTVTLTPEEGYTYAIGVTKAFINGVEVSVIEADENKIVFGGYLYSSERNYYFVSFGAGEGASGHMDEVKVKDGMFTLPECEFEPALGMQFLAWSTDGTIAGAVYGTIEVNEGLSLTALWEDPEAHTHVYGSDYDGFNEFEHYKLCISPNCPDYGSEASKGEVMGHNCGNNTPCDSVCLDCGYERVNLGVVDGVEIPLHFYEFPCTEFCAVCGKFREVEHTPGPEANCMNPQICTVCGDPLHEANDNHTPGDAATCGKDQICTLCGEVVTPASGEHTPGQEADCTNPQTCTVCGNELAPAKGHEAGVEWLSDEGGHYKLCYCGDKTNEGEHIDEDGNELCDECGYNMAGGLGVGAIVAIVVAGVVLVGGGGFCLFWFVFKKKKIAEE